MLFNFKYMTSQKHPFKYTLTLVIGSDEIDNFIHAKVISMSAIAQHIVVKKSIRSAVHFLRLGNHIGKLPELIFIDVSSFPEKGKVFFEWFNQLPAITRNKSKIIVLSLDADENARILNYIFIKKPLTVEKLYAVNWE